MKKGLAMFLALGLCLGMTACGGQTEQTAKGDPSQTTLTWWESFCFGMLDLSKRQGW